MSFSTKALIAIFSILLIGAIAFIIYQQVQISNRQQDIETMVVKQKDLVDGITRSMNEYATRKDIETFVKDNGMNLQAIQDDLKLLHAEVAAVNVITVVSGGYNGGNLPSTNVGPNNPNPITSTVTCNGSEVPCLTDPFKYMQTRQNLALFEPFGDLKVPLGEVGFSAWQQNPWNVNILPREYHVTSVVGTDENQRQYFYNKFTVKVDNKNYDVKITTATTKQEYPESKFRWSPNLFLGLDGGLNLSQTKGEFTPSINIGIASLGRYQNSPDFSFAQFGVGYGVVSDKLQVSVTPFAYNIGKALPLINNTYIGPSIHLSTSGNFSVMGGIRVGL